eukprot:NODE_3625_length_1187_cov_106.378759_g2070_i1.p1 GENE.NODE_3625_length_1187_cov_106.378759_g2070_i1~~NODE_3625_length_1187_cov_106.378759_g2070_i1.p1  ORF type:complete len:268 (+),score=42.10 NODE_3625_length_1187_cov_106.378759_g2070_i1:60-863(+)
MASSPPTEVEVILERDRSGEIVRRWRKGRFLGRGGFAKVYEVTDLSSQRSYAAKIVDKKILAKPKTEAKLKTEIKIHTRLHHRHIVRFERYFDTETHVYIILELCAGLSLIDLQRRRGQFTELEAQYFMLQIMDAVKYMHANSVIHRDLKLGNFFLDENFNIKIGVCNPNLAPVSESQPSTTEPMVYVKRWMKTKHAIIFRLSNKSVQVAFFDQSEIMLSSEERVVWYTNPVGERVAFSLQSAIRPPEEIAKRLKYTKDILYELIHR